MTNSQLYSLLEICLQPNESYLAQEALLPTSISLRQSLVNDWLACGTKDWLFFPKGGIVLPCNLFPKLAHVVSLKLVSI